MNTSAVSPGARTRATACRASRWRCGDCMTTTVSGLSRIDKLFVDRDGTEADAARARREEFTVAICCGNDVEGSYTLQLAALTAVSLAARCFPGAVRVVLSEKLQA